MIYDRRLSADSPALVRPLTRDGARRLLASGASLDFLLRDDFTADEAAPLASPRTAEPGPGTLTATGAANVSIADGRLVLVESGAYGSPRVDSQAIERQAGRALYARALMGATTYIGYADVELRARASVMDVNLLDGLGVIGFNSLVEHELAIVPRGTGAFVLIRGGSYAEWTLGWVVPTGATASGPASAFTYNSGDLEIAAFRVADLAGGFETDYGLATDRLAGAVSQGATYSHAPDALIEFTVTALPTVGGANIHFRRANADNYWRVNILANGQLYLAEMTDGTNTARGSSAVGAVTAGSRIVVVAEGPSIRVYLGGSLVISYASASTHQAEAAGQIDLGTGGAVSDLVAWPRQISGPALGQLDLLAS